MHSNTLIYLYLAIQILFEFTQTIIYSVLLLLLCFVCVVIFVTLHWMSVRMLIVPLARVFCICVLGAVPAWPSPCRLRMDVNPPGPGDSSFGWERSCGLLSELVRWSRCSCYVFGVCCFRAVNRESSNVPVCFQLYLGYVTDNKGK